MWAKRRRSYAKDARKQETSSVITSCETEIHNFKHSKVIWPCNANRNEHAGKGQKCASQHTRLLAVKKQTKKKEKMNKKEDFFFWKKQIFNRKGEQDDTTDSQKSSNTADDAGHPTKHRGQQPYWSSNDPPTL